MMTNYLVSWIQSRKCAYVCLTDPILPAFHFYWIDVKCVTTNIN